MTPALRTVLTWLPLAACVGGALAAFLLVDPLLRTGDPAMVTEGARAEAFRQAQAWYRLMIAGAAVSLLWALGLRLYLTGRAGSTAAPAR
ncbi:MAG: hypothetical protein MUF21_02375 [Gemmatimonadaceae bacterium]|jgi:hypothetical protein|nr:hypothetical protein [Gemmatimonadaceae bacterium]